LQIISPISSRSSQNPDNGRETIDFSIPCEAPNVIQISSEMLLEAALTASIYSFNISLLVLMIRIFFLHLSEPKRMEAFWTRFAGVVVERHESLQIIQEVIKKVKESPKRPKESEFVGKLVSVKAAVSSETTTQKPPRPQIQSNYVGTATANYVDTIQGPSGLNSRRKSIGGDPVKYHFEPIHVHCEPVVVYPKSIPVNPLDKMPYIASIPFRVAETSFEIATDVAAGSIKLFVIKPIQITTSPIRHLYRRIARQ
jgi:hypothetical protein